MYTSRAAGDSEAVLTLIHIGRCIIVIQWTIIHRECTGEWSVDATAAVEGQFPDH